MNVLEKLKQTINKIKEIFSKKDQVKLLEEPSQTTVTNGFDKVWKEKLQISETPKDRFKALLSERGVSLSNAVINAMYNDIFENMNDYEFQKINDEAEIKDILNSYIEKHFNISDDKETWFNKMKDLAEEKGYAREVKEYKANPEAYKGHVGDISTVIRVALTTRHNTPDLYEIMQVLGKEEVEKRIQDFIG